jgi:predicted enzyme involved in methoxymalonyl-ACP biosynthesis
MNLGVLDAQEALRRVAVPASGVVIAEMKDVYGDMGRCGVLHVTPREAGQGFIESLAISCRTQARGIALAVLIAMLRHAGTAFTQYRCRYVSTGRNRPLRMALMAAGFKPIPKTDQLVLDVASLQEARPPDWIHVNYQGLHGAPVHEARHR